MKPSLFRRLFVSLLLLLTLLFISASFLVLYDTKKRIDADYDAQLIADGHTVWTLLREDLEEGDNLGELHLDFNAPMLNAEDRGTLTQYARWRAVRIWRDKKLAAQSENLKNVMAKECNTGFSEQKIGEDTWRIYTVFVPENKITVEVWENQHNRRRLMLSIAQGLIEPGFILLPILIGLLVVTIRMGMGSLIAMAHQVKNRKPDDLSPIETGNLPHELLPLQRAINMLLEKIRRNMSHERQFIDNVAHELRTPLSALHLQGELIAKAPSEKERQECVSDLLKGIDRATHLFDQLLMLSRLSNTPVATQSFPPITLIQEVIAQRVNIAVDKQIDVSLDAQNDIVLSTNPELLQILLGVLLDNALKYTPKGGTIHLEVKPSTIIIADSGPGIPEEEREKVFERFTRGKSNTVAGNGLGLFIAKEICTQLGILIQFNTPQNGPGLIVSLHF